MNDQLTPQHARRRRHAAFELRSRAADLLDQAARLDDGPAMRLLITDIERAAEILGIPAADLVQAFTDLWAGHPDARTTKGDKS